MTENLEKFEGTCPEKPKKEKPNIEGFDNSATLRLPEVFIVLSADNVSGDKTYPGSVGIKYGNTKNDWVRLPYISMKKLIDFCIENKTLFNAQLKKEQEKLKVNEL